MAPYLLDKFTMQLKNLKNLIQKIKIIPPKCLSISYSGEITTDSGACDTPQEYSINTEYLIEHIIIGKMMLT